MLIGLVCELVFDSIYVYLEYYESFVFVCFGCLGLACCWFGFGFCLVLCDVLFCLFGGKVGFDCCVIVVYFYNVNIRIS